MRTRLTVPHELVLMLAATAAALAAQSNPGSEPKTLTEAWRAGLQRMRSQHAPGIVFVLPEAEQPSPASPSRRERLLATVQAWLDQRPAPPPARSESLPQLLLVFALAVPIFAAPEACGARPGETLLLLKPDGSRAEGFAVDLGDANAVVRALTPSLLSEAAVAAQRAVVPPALQRDVELVTQAERQGPGSAEASEAWRRVHQRLHEAAPAFVRFVDSQVRESDPSRAKVPVASGLLRRLLADTVPLGTTGVPALRGCPGPCGTGSPGPWRGLLKLLPK
jgi:hypothetical protein